MTIHTTPPTPTDQPGPEAAEPARRASRFDERGIALQTVIIIVVMLAIAASVAAILLTRAETETARLENVNTGDALYAITSQVLCGASGGTWTTGTAAGSDLTKLQAARPGAAATDDYCKP